MVTTKQSRQLSAVSRQPGRERPRFKGPRRFVAQASPSLLQKSTTRALRIETLCSAHLQVGVLTGIVASNAELELGATKADPRFLQEAHPCLPAQP
mgnify:CR=1 FL=1